MSKKRVNTKRTPSTPSADIGIIGGSGLYELEGLEDIHEVRVSTPFGPPSDAVTLGNLGGVRVAFLSRHGRGHRVSPGAINYRANIYALKSLGVRQVISVSAVGSMKESIKPGEVVLVDQFVDVTKHRVGTFFDQGIVAHVGLSDPVCGGLVDALEQAAHSTGVSVHRGGTYLCIEGPQFSTRGESLLYRQWGVDVIGMTNVPEVKLAREAELCYATVSLVTDYDCWHQTEAPVSVDAILAMLHLNVAQAKRLLHAVMPMVMEPRGCVCGNALAQAIVTSPQVIPKETRQRLDLFIGRYFPTQTGVQ